MDRSLATLLRSLQTSYTYEDATRLLPTAAALLAALTNPLNVTLLSSQLLSSSILYPNPVDLQRCRTIFTLFYTAALRHAQEEPPDRSQIRRLSRDAWARAVIEGADDKSPRWRHVLLLGGVLLGFGQPQTDDVSATLRTKLERALVTATNLALQLSPPDESDGRMAVVFVLNHTFAMLSDIHRAQLNYDLFLPLAMDATFFSREGLEHGYWLGLIDGDVRQTPARKFTWPAKSPSFQNLQLMKGKVLLSSLAPLSRLLAQSVENVRDGLLVRQTTERLADFARALAVSWRQNKLSEIDQAEENAFLDAEAQQTTLPFLWQTLRDVLLAVIIVLRSVLGRLLCDPLLASNTHAPVLAQQCLHILRNLHFISARFGHASTAHYIFANYTAIDILNQFPEHAEGFLRAIAPVTRGKIPPHPWDRTLDLFFLNTAEHFTLILGPEINDQLLLESAAPYLQPGINSQLSEISEAAHSVALSVLAGPHSMTLVGNRLPSYIDTLLSSFPASLSPRQFRLATKSIVKLAAPPSPIAQAQPLLQATLLELLRDRAAHASTDILPTEAMKRDAITAMAPATSEQATFIMAILDSLPYLTVPLLEEWLPLATELVNRLPDPSQKSLCQQRFWEVLSNGEMDSARAASCVAWWNARGGREMLLYDEIPDKDPEYMMIGALQHDSRL